MMHLPGRSWYEDKQLDRLRLDPVTRGLIDRVDVGSDWMVVRANGRQLTVAIEVRPSSVSAGEMNLAVECTDAATGETWSAADDQAISLPVGTAANPVPAILDGAVALAFRTAVRRWVHRRQRVEACALLSYVQSEPSIAAALHDGYAALYWEHSRQAVTVSLELSLSWPHSLSGAYGETLAQLARRLNRARVPDAPPRLTGRRPHLAVPDPQDVVLALCRWLAPGLDPCTDGHGTVDARLASAEWAPRHKGVMLTIHVNAFTAASSLP